MCCIFIIHDFDNSCRKIYDKRFYEDSESLKKKMFVELDRDSCLKLYEKYNSITDKTNY